MSEESYEWDTTKANYDPDAWPPRPTPPDHRDGWRCVGMTHVETTLRHVLVFAWERKQ